jgi:hypothetical protein
VSGCVSVSEIESRNRDGRETCRAWTASVCFALPRDRSASDGMVALGYSVRVPGMAGIGRDR